MYTTEEKVKMYTWYSNGSSLRDVSAIFSVEYPNRPVPSPSTINKVVKKFTSSGCVNTTHHNKRQRTPGVVTEEVEVNVLSLVENNMEKPSRQIAVECGISQTSVIRILKRHGYRSFKFENHQELIGNDMESRVDFCERMFDEINRDGNFLKRILFTDECTFFKHGAPNSQNCRYWTRENLHRYNSTKTQYPEKVNVWAGIIDTHVVGPFFIEGTINAERYCQLLEERIIPALNNLHLEGPLWYQHDGAPAHFSLQTRNILDLHFPGRWIGRGGQIGWPPRSPDLTPLDFFFWGKIKSAVYNSSPINNVEELKARITRASADILPQQNGNAVNEFYNRLGYCLIENGGIFENKI